MTFTWPGRPAPTPCAGWWSITLPSLQLVVASRVDPPLRVHRMRAHQDLVELRDADLAFSVEETRSFLAGFGVWLDEPELALVHRAARDG